MHLVPLCARDSADMAEKTDDLQCKMVTTGSMEEMWNGEGRVGRLFTLLGWSEATPKARRRNIPSGNSLCKEKQQKRGLEKGHQGV